MKSKQASLIGASVAVLFANAASAQSQVSIYGIADACFSRSDTGATTTNRLNSGCQSGSRLGFRGSEDLGGGNSATFVLENGFNIDDGSLGQGGRMFGRKATVGLSSRTFGTIEMGRDYAPTFYALSPIDPTAFGIGTLSSTMWTGSNPTTVARNDNAVNYISPALGPVTLRAQYSLGEQAAPAAKGGRNTFGFNAIYRSGAWIASVAYATHANAADTANDKATTGGLSYSSGALTLSGAVQAGRWEGSRTAAAPSNSSSIFSRDYRSFMVGGSYLLQPTLKVWVSLKRYDDRTVSNYDANQLTVATSYALSRRTDLYAAYSRLKNASTSGYAISDATTAYGAVTPGASPSLFAVGMRHAF